MSGLAAFEHYVEGCRGTSATVYIEMLDSVLREIATLTTQVTELEGLLTLNTNGRIVKEFEADRYLKALKAIAKLWRQYDMNQVRPMPTMGDMACIATTVIKGDKCGTCRGSGVDPRIRHDISGRSDRCPDCPEVEG